MSDVIASKSPMFDLHLTVGGTVDGELRCVARLTADSCKGQAIAYTKEIARAMIEQMVYLGK